MRRATTRRRELDLDRVRAAIAAAEQHTSAELVVSIAPFFVGRIWPAARRAFARLGVARTQQRNGVLIFVVPARRQVVVLADQAAHARLAPAVWHEAADRIAAAFGRGEGTAGLVSGVEHLARALAGPFPHHRDDANELPDRPVVLEPPGAQGRAPAR